jgi:hypothetical protein
VDEVEQPPLVASLDHHWFEMLFGLVGLLLLVALLLFVASTRCVAVVGRVGIVVGTATINVSLQGDDSAWRLVATVQSPPPERETTGRLPQQPVRR